MTGADRAVPAGPADPARRADPTVADADARDLAFEGRAVERTALAWRRTALALTAGGIASVQVLFPLVGTAAFLLPAATVVVSLALGVAAHRRWRETHDATTHAGQYVPLSSGLLPTLAAFAVTTLGLAAAVYLVALLAG